MLYVSTHQFPYYPGTGAAGEAGRGKGTGSTVNVPLPAGCGDAIYLGVLQRVLVPVTEKFRPELILVSCGFDAHVDDPLAAMQVTGAGFHAMTRDRARARGGLLRRPRRLRARGRLRGERPVRGHAARCSRCSPRPPPRRCPRRSNWRAEACSRPWWDAWPRCTAAGIPASAPPDPPERRFESSRCAAASCSRARHPTAISGAERDPENFFSRQQQILVAECDQVVYKSAEVGIGGEKW